MTSPRWGRWSPGLAFGPPMRLRLPAAMLLTVTWLATVRLAAILLAAVLPVATLLAACRLAACHLAA